MTLPAATARRLQLSIDIMTALWLRQVADVDRRDRQTDGLTDTRPLDIDTAFYAGSKSKKERDIRYQQFRIVL